MRWSTGCLCAVAAVAVTGCTEPPPGQESAPRYAEAIVVGAGLSGLSAAVEMGREGVHVVLLDMNSVMGGHAVMAGGFAIVDTPVQREQGYADSPEEAYGDWMEWTEDGNPEWTRFYAENSREMIYDWLGEMGAHFVRVQAGHENSVPRFHFTPRGALDVVLALYREALTLPTVAFEWNERVEALVVDDGRIIGVETLNVRTGVERTLHAPHIVLATGGFEGNLQRVLEHWRTDLPKPDRLVLGASIHATGTGHDLAEDAGAVLAWMNRHYIYTNGMVDPRDPEETLAITAGNSAALWVNAQGNRFTNEAGFDKTILVDVLDQEPTTYWAIFDESSREAFSMRGREWINNPVDGHNVLDHPEATIKSQSLEQLASMAGLPHGRVPGECESLQRSDRRRCGRGLRPICQRSRRPAEDRETAVLRCPVLSDAAQEHGRGRRRHARQGAECRRRCRAGALRRGRTQRKCRHQWHSRHGRHVSRPRAGHRTRCRTRHRSGPCGKNIAGNRGAAATAAAIARSRRLGAIADRRRPEGVAGDRARGLLALQDFS